MSAPLISYCSLPYLLSSSHTVLVSLKHVSWALCTCYPPTCSKLLPDIHTGSFLISFNSLLKDYLFNKPFPVHPI